MRGLINLFAFDYLETSNVHQPLFIIGKRFNFWLLEQFLPQIKIESAFFILKKGGNVLPTSHPNSDGMQFSPEKIKIIFNLICWITFSNYSKFSSSLTQVF